MTASDKPVDQNLQMFRTLKTLPSHCANANVISLSMLGKSVCLTLQGDFSSQPKSDVESRSFAFR